MANKKKSMRLGKRTVAAVLATVLVWASGCGLQPTIDAGIDQTVVEGDTVTLTAINGSTATLSNFLWEQTDGPLVVISGAETTQATFTAPSVNQSIELVFRVTAFSSLGTLNIPVFPDTFDLSADLNVPATDTVTITVEPIPVPDVDAGGDLAANVGETVVLGVDVEINIDGVGSKFTWTQTSGPEVELLDADTPNPSFTVPTVGEATTLVFKLTVETRDGVSASDTLSVTIDPGALPTALITAPATAYEGQIVTFSAVASTDPDGGSLTYAWEQIDDNFTLTLEDPTSEIVSFTASTVTKDTALTLQLTVTSERGGSATALHTITIQPYPLPTAIIAAPATAYEGQTVTFSAVASTDPDGGSLTYAWQHIDDNFAIALEDPTSEIISFTASTVTKDTALILQLTVTSERGGSATVLHTITIQPYPLPIASAGPDQVVEEGDPVTLDGSGSVDPAGGKLTLSWSSSFATLTFSSTLIEKPVFDAPAVTANTGYTITLTVTNEQGDQATDTVGITVLNVP